MLITPAILNLDPLMNLYSSNLSNSRSPYRIIYILFIPDLEFLLLMNFRVFEFPHQFVKYIPTYISLIDKSAFQRQFLIILSHPLSSPAISSFGRNDLPQDLACGVVRYIVLVSFRRL